MVVCWSACSRSGERDDQVAGSSRDPSAPIQTDATSYLLARDGVGWRADMRLVFHNVTGDTLHAVNCNGALTLAVERRVEAGWTTFWAPLTNGCLSPPVTIPPGDSLG